VGRQPWREESGRQNDRDKQAAQLKEVVPLEF
jgi:hypothetical protein